MALQSGELPAGPGRAEPGTGWEAFTSEYKMPPNKLDQNE